jgi:hypothetical protein
MKVDMCTVVCSVEETHQERAWRHCGCLGFGKLESQSHNNHSVQKTIFWAGLDNESIPGKDRRFLFF